MTCSCCQRSYRRSKSIQTRMYGSACLLLLSLFQADGSVCPPRLPPKIKPPNLSSLPPKRRERYEAVKSAISHAWNGYIQNAYKTESYRPWFPADDLKPLSPASGENWLHYAATLHDSLDTLYLAQLDDEYKHGSELVKKYDFQTTSSSLYEPTKTFEYSLRVVGGMIGATSLSGDAVLFQAAKRAADALLEGPFKSSWTPLPRIYEVLAPAVAPWFGWITSPYSWMATKCHRLQATIYRIGRDLFTEEHRINSLAGVGSFGLEFAMLSFYSGEPQYQDAHEDILHVVESFRTASGGVPILWDSKSGQPAYFNEPLRGHSATSQQPCPVGSGADSFFEYLIKIPILKGCGSDDNKYCNAADQMMLTMYHQFVANELRSSHVTKLEAKPNIAYPSDGYKYNHLICFLPGMLALGSHHHLSEDGEADLELAGQLMRGCWDTYERSPTGLGPESATLLTGEYAPLRKSYLLRPETVESLWVLYRVTKNPIYQEWAWSIFMSIERHCKVDQGYAGLMNVYNASDGHVNDMPSYFIAETLKYLLLMFGPDDYVSIEEFVMTTEAHPLRVLKDDGRDSNSPCWWDTREIYNPQVFMPWWVFSAVCVVWTIVAFASWCLWRLRLARLSDPRVLSRKNR